ncbi:hybrid sensor histidine kinase/response regulator [Sulfurimonas sp.]|uniref:hybrid sensor histidine kinase/response regulator n=1 Tax=Sulfurimonas sp. TaxID=2022749 RepID=UPI002B4997B7|nr:ATP-binding protein [Sulfurimonas sp.]
MYEKLPNLVKHREIFINSKNDIITKWLSYTSPQKILKQYDIEKEFFLSRYAGGVFDYFMNVIEGSVKIGQCPIMHKFLLYLKHKEISADELFEICNHFRRSMIDFSYDKELDSKDMTNEISFIFDKNFRGVLKFHTETVFQKLIDARKTADTASQAKEYFLSNMSHEIRTPLNAILGFVNLLMDENVSKKHRNYLNIIFKSGENLLSIINDILDFSKLRSGEFTIEAKNFSAHDEISQTMELFVASANEKNITITSFIDPYIPKKLYADSLRMKQILSNFLSNAIKFTSVNGHICVEASYENRNLILSVTDNGVGIKKQDLDSIFTAFVQANYEQLKNLDGTGLGLSICHQLVQRMGGKINVTSTFKKGSTFSISLPASSQSELCPIYENILNFQSYKIVIYSEDNKDCYKANSFLKYAKIFDMNVEIVNNLDNDFDIAFFVNEDVNADFKAKLINSDKKFIAMVNTPSDEYDKYDNIAFISFPLYCSKIRDTFSEIFNPDAYSPHKKNIATKFIGHILVAEDNEANQELIKIILAKYGLSFSIAHNGLEAVNLYKQNHYDLILMDEQMPIMDGTQAVKEILDYEISKGLGHTPVSALTANVVKGAKEKRLSSGFDSFLGKPIILKDIEEVFNLYLKVNFSENNKIKIQKSKDSIIGLDTTKLKEELMLNQDELLMLLKLFIKKMKKQLPELEEDIKNKEYKKIALNAHSIKGSSGNFRIESIQHNASEMEEMAKNEDANYNYKICLEKIRRRIQEIEIS